MATKSIAWNTGTGNITLIYQGQGDGPISIQSDVNNGSARSQVITVETVGGAITRNFTVNQAACPFPVGDVKNFSYTGSYQEVELPAGQYKLQCWGAQGGSNAAASSYSITAKAGGKGGYSEGIITISQKTTVRVYVGGQGSSSAGGYNGGGSTTGTSSYNASNEYGTSRMGGGGGATDIRLSDGALLSRFIVAGGGSGGAMCYRSKTTTSTTWQTVGSYSGRVRWDHETGTVSDIEFGSSVVRAMTPGTKYRVTGVTGTVTIVSYRDTVGGSWTSLSYSGGFTATSGFVNCGDPSSAFFTVNVGHTQDSYVSYTLQKQVTTSSTSTSNESQVGGVGGGTSGGGYSSTYQGKQNAAGSNGSFGTGAAMSTTGYRYCSGAGGGGWYGGGSAYSDSSMTYCKYSGGGSGFVNTATSAGNRPSGYVGLQLDSGETKAGDTSFPSTSVGTETGHSGNGYAKITRLDPNIMEFEYSGAVESKTLAAGTYKIECWGAQGGSYNTTYYGGKGGYSVGEITLESQTTVYIRVGGQGAGNTSTGARTGGFNGGGNAYCSSSSYANGAGGGASDVRVGQDSLYARVIVAGGGGGAGSYSSSYRYVGGAGGGTTGVTPSQYSTSYRAGTGGTQTAKGDSYYSSTANSTSYGNLAAFGTGASYTSTSYGVTGGGGGWYGGGYSYRGAAGGGSGYVYNVDTASSYPSGCLLNSSHYLANSQTITGDTSMPSTSGSTEIGHEGNGFVRITKI